MLTAAALLCWEEDNFSENNDTDFSYSQVQVQYGLLNNHLFFTHSVSF